MKPFFPWVGGKSRFLDVLTKNLPEVASKKYCEPFLGSGALFLKIAPEKALISDSNKEIINVWRCVKENPNEVISEFNKLSEKHSKANFESVRALDRNPSFGIIHFGTSYPRAARFLYLIKSSFNSVYRVNSKGFCNSPFNYKKSISLDEKNILEVSNYLNNNNIQIECQDFRKSLQDIKGFVYLDPPYDGVYNSYTKNKFGFEDQCALAKQFKILTEHGQLGMVSNLKTNVILSLYRSFHIEEIPIKRLINPRSDKRKIETEVLIKNFCSGAMEIWKNIRSRV